ncbi:AAA family ATPase [uncultured Solobacterium sp.]|uniref:AAA family ATPase n=1 Tax=uncultured Solobacterium sp. TaxID=747375 RepID=UPI0028E4CB52|nr:AAA family ATPase [uncultured Solobacterium sp.]
MKVIEIIDNKDKHNFLLVKNESNFSLRYSSNITSLTCIVGKNGSGKTRFLDSLLCKDKDLEIKTDDKNDENLSIIKYSGAIELHKNINIPDGSFDISTSYLLSTKSLNEVNRNDSIYQVSVMIDLFDSLTTMIKQDYKSVKIKLTDAGEAIKKYGDRYLSNILDNSDFKNINKQLNLKPKHIMPILLKKFISILFDILKLNDYNNDNSAKTKSILDSINFNDLKPKHQFNKLVKEFLQAVNNTNDTSCDIELELSKLKQFFTDIKFFFNSYKNEWDLSNKNDRNTLKQYVKMMINNNPESSISSEVFSVIEFEWNGLSSGELALLNLFGRLHEIKDKVKDNILLLIDEVDLGLHPEWQRRWVKDVLPIIGNILTVRKKILQIIISTHSPIILSDIYTGDIIFLSEKTDNQTFGQNIYELFNSSFFLDRVQGEFSTKYISDISKILESKTINKDTKEKIKDFLSEYFEITTEEECIKEFESAINIIGEPIIRNHFLYKLRELKNEDIEELIYYHEQAILRLKGKK